MKQAEHILQALVAPWAILPEVYREMLGVFERWTTGEKLTPEMRAEIEARIGKPLEAEKKRYTVTPEGVAVIPVQGILTKRAGMLTEWSGGTSTQQVGMDFREALERADVKAIMLDVDSPGGSVDGPPELAREIYQARGKKPITTFADGMMASAATWIGLAADEAYLAAETTLTGSIGIVRVHSEYSEYYEKAGIKNTVMTAGKYKALGNEYQPLGKEAKKVFQEELDYLYSIFVNDVAEFRGTSAEAVQEDMADGRIFYGSQAVKNGLVDGIKSRDEVMRGLVDRSNGTYRADTKQQATYKPGGNAQKAGGSRMDLETLKKDHPELYAMVVAEGKSLGVTEGKAAGIEEGKKLGAVAGAEAERARIQGVFGVRRKGTEAVVDALMFDGKTTAIEAKAAAFDAQVSLGAQVLARIQAEAPDPAKASLGVEAVDAAAAAEAKLEGEPKWKAEFAKDPKLQEKYAGSETAYVAYKKAEAEGKVR